MKLESRNLNGVFNSLGIPHFKIRYSSFNIHLFVHIRPCGINTCDED